MMPSRLNPHDETWLQLPWLANGRLAGAERGAAEEHLRDCPDCREELERQRLLCEALTEPQRVTYAPGPSFRKLMERIDGAETSAAPSAAPAPLARPRTPPRAAGARLATAWRPPGLAWAATFLLMMGMAVMVRWWQPAYVTVTRSDAPTPGVLHVAFDRSLALGDMEQLLHAAGARVVEGPDPTGVFGVAPGVPQSASVAQLRAIAARLRTDPRVRWIQPLGEEAQSDGAQGRRTGAH
jgi:hypothetical protein